MFKEKLSANIMTLEHKETAPFSGEEDGDTEEKEEEKEEETEEIE